MARLLPFVMCIVAALTVRDAGDLDEKTKTNSADLTTNVGPEGDLKGTLEGTRDVSSIICDETNARGSQWSATETTYRYQNTGQCTEWETNSNWIIIQKLTGFVPAPTETGKGPLFIAGKITEQANVVEQAKRMYDEGLRIADFANLPQLMEQAKTMENVYPNPGTTVEPRKDTPYTSTRGDDAVGNILVVQVGYHQKNDEEQFKYVGNGFYWQAPYGGFIANNAMDDGSVWFTPIPATAVGAKRAEVKTPAHSLAEEATFAATDAAARGLISRRSATGGESAGGESAGGNVEGVACTKDGDCKKLGDCARYGKCSCVDVRSRNVCG